MNALHWAGPCEGRVALARLPPDSPELVTTRDDLANCDDAALASAIVSGAGAPGEEAELCRRFAPRVRLYGLRHLRDEDLAAELVQRVLMLTLEKLRSRAVREPERIASFVLGSARLTARDMLRKQRRERPADETVPEPWAEPATAPLERRQLARCLEALSERERSVVVLTFFHEQSSAEIAAATGMTDTHVRVVRHRAIQRLRGCMDQPAGISS